VNKKVDRLSQDALDLLKRYTWPGNLRELENIVERAVVLTSGQQVDVAHLPLYLQESGPIRVTTQEGFVQAKERVVSMFEKEAVARFLSEARGNISVAAQKAGITRRNFHRLLSKYSISSKKFKKES
jgi:DNA-binding NtrC family response regulator